MKTMIVAWHAVGQWKTGRWSIEELRTLKRNIRAFKKVICFASTPVPSLWSGFGLQD